MYRVTSNPWERPWERRHPYAAMLNRGADVRMVNLGYPLNHLSAFIPAQITAKAWFDTFDGGSNDKQ